VLAKMEMNEMAAFNLRASMTDRTNFDQLALENGRNVNWEKSDNPNDIAEDDFKVALQIAEDFEEEWVDDVEEAKSRWIEGFVKAYNEAMDGE
jgi:hypothetical protein